jgi:hypothetical protein
MATQPTQQHKLGAPWSDAQIEKLIKDLTEGGELDAVDAIVWLRFELARAKLGAPRGPARSR